jgi:hypothetical protein
VAGTSKSNEQTNKLTAQIAAVKKKKDRLLNLNIDGRISDDEFQERNNDFNNEIAEINRKITKAQEDTKKGQNLTKAMDEIRNVLLAEMDFDSGLNNSIVDALIERIEIHKTENPNVVDVKVLLKALGQTKLLRLKKIGRQGQVNAVKPDTGLCYPQHKPGARRYP